MKRELRISISGDDLLHNLDALPAESIPAAIARLAAAQGVLAARLLASNNGNSSEPQADRLLDVHEAAEMTDMSVDYLYRHADEFPFTVRVGRKERKSLKFSLLGIHKYIEMQSSK